MTPAALRIEICEPGYPVTGVFDGRETTHGVSDARAIIQDGTAYVTERGAENLRRWLASGRLQHNGVAYMTPAGLAAAMGVTA